MERSTRRRLSAASALAGLALLVVAQTGSAAWAATVPAPARPSVTTNPTFTVVPTTTDSVTLTAAATGSPAPSFSNNDFFSAGWSAGTASGITGPQVTPTAV